MTKKIIIIVVTLIIIIFFCSIARPNDVEKINKDKIILYINDNYEIIEKFPYNDIKDIKYQNKRNIIIKNYFGENTIVEDVYAYSDDILEFSCGASGFLDVGTYYGFYFSKNNTPYAFEFGNVDFIETGIDTFEWHDEKGKLKEHKGHSIYTEKIRDNWWYYEMIWH